MSNNFTPSLHLAFFSRSESLANQAFHLGMSSQILEKLASMHWVNTTTQKWYILLSNIQKSKKKSTTWCTRIIFPLIYWISNTILYFPHIFKALFINKNRKWVEKRMIPSLFGLSQNDIRYTTQDIVVIFRWCEQGHKYRKHLFDWTEYESTTFQSIIMKTKKYVLLATQNRWRQTDRRFCFSAREGMDGCVHESAYIYRLTYTPKGSVLER